MWATWPHGCWRSAPKSRRPATSTSGGVCCSERPNYSRSQTVDHTHDARKSRVLKAIQHPAHPDDAARRDMGRVGERPSREPAVSGPGRCASVTPAGSVAPRPGGAAGRGAIGRCSSVTPAGSVAALRSGPCGKALSGGPSWPLAAAGYTVLSCAVTAVDRHADRSRPLAICRQSPARRPSTVTGDAGDGPGRAGWPGIQTPPGHARTGWSYRGSLVRIVGIVVCVLRLFT